MRRSRAIGFAVVFAVIIGMSAVVWSQGWFTEPRAMLFNNSIEFTQAVKTKYFQFTTDPGDGKLFTSDVGGYAGWETISEAGIEPAQTPASQVEAEAGTEAGIRSWSPLRIFQAIASWWDTIGRLAPGAIGDTTPASGTFSPTISKGKAAVTSFTGTISSSGATATFTSPLDSASAGYKASNVASGLGTTVIAGGQTRYIIAWTNSTTCTLSSAPSPAWGAETAITSVQEPSSNEVTSAGTLTRWTDAAGDEHFVGSVSIGAMGNNVGATPVEKTDDYVITISDFGKTFVMNSALEKTFTFPTMSASYDGARIRLIKGGVGNLIIQAGGTNTIYDSTAGGTIRNDTAPEAGLAYLDFEYIHVLTKWLPIGRGTWQTT